MNKNRSWLKSPWTISISTALLVPSLTFIRDVLRDLPILSTLKSVLIAGWKYLIIFLNLKIKVWWILAFIALAVIVLFLIDRFQDSSPSAPVLQKPDFCSYKSGRLKRWKWTWDWRFNTSTRKWNIIELTAHCPECDTALIEEHNIYGTNPFLCPRCNLRANRNSYIEEPYIIESIILDNIKRGILE